MINKSPALGRLLVDVRRDTGCIRVDKLSASASLSYFMLLWHESSSHSKPDLDSRLLVSEGLWSKQPASIT